ncbi:peptide/nickel transport system substrate-binding protein [Paraburkholderia fungorum]|uniref:Peptide/nickel transport system substrate-binding protein n=1 Tax=Paraburkholderia fungorum TaxID=134537 RepID=A0A1H1JVQ9_9BURK|nr:ABC transporter substrate-binding protein [Paraburkholderia fungorum]SDR53932.1 peptide/nickel transport system substrate-binding protein [Paraburkholderia fungorum]
MLYAAPAQAQEVRIGLSAAITSLDPHFYNATPNHTVALNIFEPLVSRDATGRLMPSLATSWKSISDTVWEFNLRKGVHWHDGSFFSAKDVVFSLNRVKNVPGAPGGFSGLINTIVKVESVDDLTVHITTSVPTPNLPMQLSFIEIVSQKAGSISTTADYNSGRAMIGTGPYKFEKYVTNERLSLVRNDDWWNGKPQWAHVTYEVVTNAATRTTSILAGDIDVAETPPAQDIERLRNDSRFRLFSAKGLRVAYVMPFYQASADAEPVTDASGNRITPSPLTNLAVRKALSGAIDRSGLASKIMFGTAEPTGQFLPPGVFSSLSDVGVPKYDPVAAKKLLAESGYPDGFSLTLTATNDRVPYSVEVAQAIAQMWSRIGVRTKVNAVPTSIGIKLASNQSVPVYIDNWGNSSFEAGSILGSLLGTVDPGKSRGTYNWSRYSNPALDQQVDTALRTVDTLQREKLLQDASRVALDNLAVIPLFNFVNYWVTRKGYAYVPRADGLTLANAITAQ